MSEQFGYGEQLRIGQKVGLRVAVGPLTDTGVEDVCVAHAAIASVLPAQQSIRTRATLDCHVATTSSEVKKVSED